jgi:hypothetical protein
MQPLLTRRNVEGAQRQFTPSNTKVAGSWGGEVEITRLLLQNGTFFAAEVRKAAACGPQKGQEMFSRRRVEADSSLQSWTCGHSRGAHRSLLFGFLEEYLRLAWMPVWGRSLKNPVGCDPTASSTAGGAGSTAGRDRQGDTSPAAARKQDCLTVSLECHDTVNTIGAEDAELAFVITAEVDEAATTLTSAG